jgi:hypothetical protein
MPALCIISIAEPMQCGVLQKHVVGRQHDLGQVLQRHLLLGVAEREGGVR